VVTLELPAGNKALVFEIASEGIKWCRLYATTKNDKTKLGANVFEKIKKNILTALMPPYITKKGIINGVNVFTVVNLMEPHAAILASPTENFGLTLYFLPINDFYPLFELAKEDIQLWVSKLTSFKI